MKPLFFIILIFFSVGLFAQDSVQNTLETAVKTPKIVMKLPIQKTSTVNGITIKFLSVVSDSRCPKNVNCIWAGEVVVLVEVKEASKKTVEKTITIGFKRNPKGNETTIIFKGDAFTIKAITVSPFPEYGVEVDALGYVLHFDVVE